MKASQTCINLIKEYEGLRLEPYRDGGDNLTIGYGHKLPDESRVAKISEHVALSLLMGDIRIVTKQLNSLNLKLTQYEFDALISFIFNLGIGNFLESTLYRKLHEGDKDGAAQEFDRWTHIKDRRTKEYRRAKGLVRRRHAEQQLFIGAI